MNHRKSENAVASLKKWGVGVILVCAVILMGCKKQEAPVTSSAQIINATKLRPAFSSAPPEVQTVVDNVMMAIQGSDPVKARSELDRLAKMPGVTDAQQTVIKDLSDQLDRKIASSAETAKPNQ